MGFLSRKQALSYSKRCRGRIIECIPVIFRVEDAVSTLKCMVNSKDSPSSNITAPYEHSKNGTKDPLSQNYKYVEPQLPKKDGRNPNFQR